MKQKIREFFQPEKKKNTVCVLVGFALTVDHLIWNGHIYWEFVIASVVLWSLALHGIIQERKAISTGIMGILLMLHHCICVFSYELFSLDSAGVAVMFVMVTAASIATFISYFLSEQIDLEMEHGVEIEDISHLAGGVYVLCIVCFIIDGMIWKTLLAKIIFVIPIGMIAMAYGIACMWYWLRKKGVKQKEE